MNEERLKKALRGLFLILEEAVDDGRWSYTTTQYLNQVHGSLGHPDDYENAIKLMVWAQEDHDNPKEEEPYDGELPF